MRYLICFCLFFLSEAHTANQLNKLLHNLAPLQSLKLEPAQMKPIMSRNLKESDEISGFLNYFVYLDADTCSGEPWAYYGLKQSYCHPRDNDQSERYTCVNDEVRNTVNISVTVYEDDKCESPLAVFEVPQSATQCNDGLKMGCTSSNEPWANENGTLAWVFSDRSCKKQMAYYIIFDTCLVGDGDGILIECRSDEKGYFYDIYEDDTTCSSVLDSSIYNSFSACKSTEEETDDYYGDNEEEEEVTYLVTCCADDTKVCSKNSKVDDDSNVCFAASEMVTTPTGSIAISEVSVGDVVLVMTAEGIYTFAEVVYVPHAANTISSSFITLTTSTSSIKATPKHMLPAAPCSTNVAQFPLRMMEDVSVGDCILTIHGKQQVVQSHMSIGAGVYTLVTSETSGFIIVNDIVASSFATNHALVNNYYTFWRMVRRILPFQMFSSALNQATLMLGSVVYSVA